MIDPTLAEHDPAYGKRAEFAELARDTGRMRNARTFAQLDGAMNLLTKAVTRLDAGETEQADRLIARAAAMPYAADEEGSPGVRGAAQLAYDLVSDQLESSTEDDSRWLTAAVDVHAELDGAGRVHLESVLHGFVLQAGLYSLTPAETRLIRRTFGHAPLEADVGDGPDMTAAERVVVIGSLLESVRALRSAYDVEA